MTTLFILNRASARDLRACLPLLGKDDGLLCIEDAVYLLAENLPELPQILANSPCFALREDLVARGISAKIPPRIIQVGYSEFVALTLRYARIINW
jgi:tRNA 2-thiouridine synthesizing protein B